MNVSEARNIHWMDEWEIEERKWSRIAKIRGKGQLLPSIGVGYLKK